MFYWRCLCLYLYKIIIMKETATFKIEPELLDQLKAIAKSQNRSFSNLMQIIVNDFLANQEGGTEGEK